jgi:hypothetical protein
MPREYIEIIRSKDTTRISREGMEVVEIIRADHNCDICLHDISTQRGTGFGISVPGEHNIRICGGCVTREWLRMLEGRMEADETREVSHDSGRESPENAKNGG